MDSVGLDMLLDIHGDEELPYNFINGNEVCPALNTCWMACLCLYRQTARLQILAVSVLHATESSVCALLQDLAYTVLCKDVTNIQQSHPSA